MPRKKHPSILSAVFGKNLLRACFRPMAAMYPVFRRAKYFLSRLCQAHIVWCFVRSTPALLFAGSIVTLCSLERMAALFQEVKAVEENLERLSHVPDKQSGAAANTEGIIDGLKRVRTLLEDQNLSLQDLEFGVADHQKTVDSQLHSMDNRIRDLEGVRVASEEKVEKLNKSLKALRLKSKKMMKSPSTENVAGAKEKPEEFVLDDLSPRRDSSTSMDAAVSKFMAEMQEKMEAMLTRQSLTRASVGIFRGHRGIVNQIVPAPSEEGCFITASSDKQIMKWNGAKCKAIKVLSAESAVTKLEILSDKLFVTAGGDGNIRLWNWQADKAIYKQDAHKRVITGLHPITDSRLVSCSSDGTIRVWSTTNQKIVPSHIFNEHTDSVNSVSVSDGGQIASCSDDRTVRLWDLHSGKGLRMLKSDSTKSLAAFLDENTLATASADKNLIDVWDTRQARPIRELIGHFGGVRVLQKMGDGLISGGKDGQALQWTLRESAGPKTRFVGHSDWINAICSAGRSLIATASCDLTVRVWADEGRCVQVFQGHTGNITQMAFDAGNNILATASNDCSVRLWSPNFHQ